MSCLASYDWYHGPISRQMAVDLMENDGDFLVRDCISKPGELVLTCMAVGGKILHFRFNRVDQDGVAMYQFEGEFFTTVPALIGHHLSTGQPISTSSQAIISRPRINAQSAPVGAIYAKLNTDRSQSSLSGDTGSTVSSSGSCAQPLAKSGSRASLLKDHSKETNQPSPQGELKRFKSLPGGKVCRVKRRAPSPPKNQKPLPSIKDCPAQNQVPKSLHLQYSTSEDKGSSLERKRNSFIEGVKLRRKKFTHLLQKPLNLSQRQSMHVAAHLQEYLNRANSRSNGYDNRRYSMPRLLDVDEDDLATTNMGNLSNGLVRSPSDTSLMYLSQLGLVPYRYNQPQKPLPSLPVKQKMALSDAPQVQREMTSANPSQEALYDCLPSPRPCLSQQQLRFNEIYDVPRNLITPNDLKVQCVVDPRSVSAFGNSDPSYPRHGRKISSDCISVCSAAFYESRNSAQNNLSRHRNYLEGLNDARAAENSKPPLPPKSRVSRRSTRIRDATCEDYYACPKTLQVQKTSLVGCDDSISLCSSFSYCSECTNTSSAQDSASTISRSLFNNDVVDLTPLRFSPTSLISDDDDHLSLQFDDDDTQSCLSYLENRRELSVGNPRSGIAAMSNLSSVSSITLQGDDISMGFDTTSLPEDPFPEGLPSSASSTIGSPPSSCSSGTGDFKNSEILPLDNDFQENLDPEGVELTSVSVKKDPSEISSNSDEIISSSSTPTTTAATFKTNPQCADPVMPENIENSVSSKEADDYVNEAENDETGSPNEANQDQPKESFSAVDIFNHRSSSRARIRSSATNQLRCKSQPNYLDSLVDDDDGPIWMAADNAKSMHSSWSPSDHKNVIDSTNDTIAITNARESFFDPKSFQTMYLPIGGNKPLDPMAVSAVHRTLVDTPAPILAVHLTHVDLTFFGLHKLSGGEGRYELLTRPEGHRFRLDILERYKSFRTFVEVTVLAASNIVESTRVVAQWVRIADEARKRLGNYFAFFTIATGLILSPYLGQWDNLWVKLEQMAPAEYELLNGPFRNAIEMKNAVTKDCGVVTLPVHIVSYVVGGINASENGKIVQELQSELLPGSKNAACEMDGDHAEEDYKKNAQITFRHIKRFEDLLLDLFRTEFHIRLLWGSSGLLNYPDNFNDRHSKFAKVLSALAAICARQ